jgi:hypothetical protein
MQLVAYICLKGKHFSPVKTHKLNSYKKLKGDLKNDVFLARFEANFGAQTVLFSFKCMGLPEVQPGQIKILRKGSRMEVHV